MKIKQLIINTIWYGVIPKITAILSILLLPLITPFLTLEDYGVIGLINSYKGIALGVVTLGLHLHLTNSYFELGKNFKLLWRRLFFYMIVSASFAALVLAFVYFFSLPITPITKKVLVIGNLIAGITAILVSFVMIKYYHLGYIGWVISYVITSLMVFVLFLKPLYIDLKIYPQIDFKRNRIRKLLKISLPVIPHSLSHILLSSSDRIMMDILGVSVLSIGLYSNGYSIGENANTVIQGIFIALSPILQRIYRDKDQIQMKYYYRTANLVVSIFILLTMLWMKEFYAIFVRNDSFQPAYIIAILTCTSYLVNATIYLYLSSAIFINKNTQKILYLVFFPAILNIILNIIFIPIYGFMAALYTTIFTYWIVFVLPFIFPSFKEMIREMIGSRKIMIEGLFVNILVLLIAYLCYDINYIFKILIVILMFLCAYFYYKNFNFKRT